MAVDVVVFLRGAAFLRAAFFATFFLGAGLVTFDFACVFFLGEALVLFGADFFLSAMSETLAADMPPVGVVYMYVTKTFCRTPDGQDGPCC